MSPQPIKIGMIIGHLIKNWSCQPTLAGRAISVNKLIKNLRITLKEIICNSSPQLNIDADAIVYHSIYILGVFPE